MDEQSSKPVAYSLLTEIHISHRDILGMLSSNLFCRCMLESRGLIVRSIPFYEWNSADGVEQQKAYLSHLLASAYVCGYQ